MINIYDAWPTIALERLIVDMQPGFAQRPLPDNNGVSQLRTNNVSPDGQLDLSEIKYVDASINKIDKYGVRRGDVIFNNTNSLEWVGKTAYFDKDEVFVLSNHMTRLRANVRIMDPEFLAHYLHFLWRSRVSQRWAKQWVNQAAIDQSALAQFPILVPTLPEQQRIVAILRQADELRRLRAQANARMNDLLPALFHEMFEDIDKLPQRKLSDVCEFITKGTTPKAEDIADHPNDESVPFLKVYHITGDGAIDFDSSKSFISRSLHTGLLNRSKVYPGDVLMNIVGPPLGKIGIVPDTYPEWNVNQAIAIFRTAGEIDPIYLLHVLRNPAILLNLLKQAVGVRQLNLSLTQCRDFRIPVPAISEQSEFVQKAKMVSRLREIQSLSDRRISHLFNSLLARSFTGELTATWREAHHTDLKAEARKRDELLNLSRTIKFAANMVAQSATSDTANLFIAPPTRAVQNDLDQTTRALLTHLQVGPAYVRPEDLAANGVTAVQTEANLRLLEALGLVRQVQVEGRLLWRCVDLVGETASKPAILA